MVQEKNLDLPTEGVKIVVPNTKAFIGDNQFGTGVLCVSENNLIWKQENGNDLCFTYPSIALHAISRDLNAFPHECLYLITDETFDGSNNEQEENSSDDSNEIVPIRFVPEDKSVLNAIFKAINECQALYPDEEMSGDEQDEEEDEVEQDENDETNFHDDEDIELNKEEFFDSNSDLNNIKLSDKGQQILRRININYQDENKIENENDIDESEKQYEDADISN